MHEGKLIVGSVRGLGDPSYHRDPNCGNVEIAVYDIATGALQRTVLHRRLEHDDHCAPALLPLPGGRYLAAYTKHDVERCVYYRISQPHDPLVWGPVVKVETPAEKTSGYSGDDNVTYSNLFRFSSGRIINLFRGYGHDPNYMYSDDSGKSWRYGGRLLRGCDGYSPYFKYAFNGKETIHFVVTEDHPREYDNSIYHGFVRGENIYSSDSKMRAPLSKDTEATIAAWEMTKVFQGNQDNVGWVVDLELDKLQRPCVVFSVQKDGHGLPRGQGGMDHRFYYGRWDGATWRVHEIAYAGTRLYPGEDDYTGLAALDPNNPDVVYISTDVDPVNGSALISSADGQRHYELFRGTTRDFGASWGWEPITAHSRVDNLRPIVAHWDNRQTALVWMRGAYYNSYGEWTTAVVAMILKK